MSEDSKKFYMWISVATVSLFIGIIWVASIKYNLSTSMLNFVKAKDNGIEVIENFKNDFNKNINTDFFGEVYKEIEVMNVSSTIKTENTTSTNL